MLNWNKGLSLAVVHSTNRGTSPQQSIIIVQGTTKFQGDTFFFAMKRKYSLTSLKEKDAELMLVQMAIYRTKLKLQSRNILSTSCR